MRVFQVHVSGGGSVLLVLSNIESIGRDLSCNSDENLITMVSGKSFRVSSHQAEFIDKILRGVS